MTDKPPLIQGAPDHSDDELHAKVLEVISNMPYSEFRTVVMGICQGADVQHRTVILELVRRLDRANRQNVSLQRDLWTLQDELQRSDT